MRGAGADASPLLAAAGLLQEDGAEQQTLHLHREPELQDRQDPEEALPVLPLPEVPDRGDAPGRYRGAARGGLGAVPPLRSLCAPRLPGRELPRRLRFRFSSPSQRKIRFVALYSAFLFFVFVLFLPGFGCRGFNFPGLSLLGKTLGNNLEFFFSLIAQFQKPRLKENFKYYEADTKTAGNPLQISFSLCAAPGSAVTRGDPPRAARRSAQPHRVATVGL